MKSQKRAHLLTGLCYALFCASYVLYVLGQCYPVFRYSTKIAVMAPFITQMESNLADTIHILLRENKQLPAVLLILFSFVLPIMKFIIATLGIFQVYLYKYFYSKVAKYQPDRYANVFVRFLQMIKHICEKGIVAFLNVFNPIGILRSISKYQLTDSMMAFLMVSFLDQALMIITIEKGGYYFWGYCILSLVSTQLLSITLPSIDVEKIADQIQKEIAAENDNQFSVDEILLEESVMVDGAMIEEEMRLLEVMSEAKDASSLTRDEARQMRLQLISGVLYYVLLLSTLLFSLVAFMLYDFMKLGTGVFAETIILTQSAQTGWETVVNLMYSPYFFNGFLTVVLLSFMFPIVQCFVAFGLFLDMSMMYFAEYKRTRGRPMINQVSTEDLLGMSYGNYDDKNFNAAKLKKIENGKNYYISDNNSDNNNNVLTNKAGEASFTSPLLSSSVAVAVHSSGTDSTVNNNNLASLATKRDNNNVYTSNAADDGLYPSMNEGDSSSTAFFVAPSSSTSVGKSHHFLHYQDKLVGRLVRTASPDIVKQKLASKQFEPFELVLLEYKRKRPHFVNVLTFISFFSDWCTADVYALGVISCYLTVNGVPILFDKLPPSDSFILNGFALSIIYGVTSFFILSITSNLESYIIRLKNKCTDVSRRIAIASFNPDNNTVAATATIDPKTTQNTLPQTALRYKTQNNNNHNQNNDNYYHKNSADNSANAPLLQYQHHHLQHNNKSDFQFDALSCETHPVSCGSSFPFFAYHIFARAFAFIVVVAVVLFVSYLLTPPNKTPTLEEINAGFNDLNVVIRNGVSGLPHAAGNCEIAPYKKCDGGSDPLIKFLYPVTDYNLSIQVDWLGGLNKFAFKTIFFSSYVDKDDSSARIAMTANLTNDRFNMSLTIEQCQNESSCIPLLYQGNPKSRHMNLTTTLSFKCQQSTGEYFGDLRMDKFVLSPLVFNISGDDTDLAPLINGVLPNMATGYLNTTDKIVSWGDKDYSPIELINHIAFYTISDPLDCSVPSLRQDVAKLQASLQNNDEFKSKISSLLSSFISNNENSSSSSINSSFDGGEKRREKEMVR